MKALMQVGLCCLLVSGAFAQRGGHGGGGVGRGGFGGGMGRGFVGGGIGRGGYIGGGRVGGFGRGFYGGFGRGFYGGFGRGFYGRYGYRGLYGRGFWGLGYGGYWPGLWGMGWWGWPDYYDYGYPDYGYPNYGSPYYGYDPSSYSPNVTVVYPQPAQTAYPVVVTQPAQPVVHEYRTPEDYGLPSEHQNRPVLYLIAFQDHIIRAAYAYWLEDDTLHYLDLDHKEKQAPLSAVDRNFSAELNRERHVPFDLQQSR